jgi:invasion protein IalB
MTKHFIGGALAAAFLLTAGAGQAQQTFERTAAQADWSVFQAGQGDNRVCWTLSKPTQSEARRGNQRVQVNRGDMYLMVAVRPAANVRNEISTVIGYTFRENSQVRVDIGSNRFSMFVDGDKAWLENAAADNQMVEAMRRGAQAVLTGVSSRGTTTIDTYSLIGFTAALQEAQRLCS